MRGVQTSETIELGAMLAISGGFMDAYSYLYRGGVFANAQTGNMLLLGVNLTEGSFAAALQYALPIAAFLLGIVAAIAVRYIFKTDESQKKPLLHWRQVMVILEMAGLFAVCFIPQQFNLVANSLISMVCGIQLESFRKVMGNGVATTMCIGNLKNATESLCRYIKDKKRKNLFKSLLYYGMILCFILGAVLGNFMIKLMGSYATMVCVAILFVLFLMMFAEEKKQGKKDV